MAVTELIERLAAAWRRHVGNASRRALMLVLLLAALGGAHLARLGTPAARGVTAGLLALSVLLLLGRWLKDRRDWRSLRRTIARVLVATNRPLGERALRALGLIERAERDAQTGSPDLARLHFERLMARASVGAVEQTASRRAFGWRVLSLILLVGSAVAFFIGPFRVLEGLDVLVARNGRAPLPMKWLEFTHVSVDPPSYLRAAQGGVWPGDTTEVAEGSLITVHGAPLHAAPELVLTDGRRETRFVSDAQGGLIARWTLGRDARLRVAARFGDVLVPEPETIEFKAVADEPPVVRLEGAPKTLELRNIDRLPIRYSASDDHGLTEVDLVLRSGNHEERHVLARLEGDRTRQSGGYALSADDPFLRRMFLPVVIAVEARDNDPLHGQKWGRSAEITLLPPPVGEPEAERYAAIVAVRDALVDQLAWQLDAPKKLDARTARERIRQRSARSKRIAGQLSAAVKKTYDGLSVSRGLAAFLRGQAQAFVRHPLPGQSAVRKTEDLTLAVDAALRGLGAYDAGVVSRRLADVADEAAQGAKQARDTEQSRQGRARLDAAVSALARGSHELVRLGALGRDIGEVAIADRHRIERARAHDDMQHAELAARHLAERLRRPDPSFASQGGGVESGPGRSVPGTGAASRAADRFNQLADELAELSNDHAAEIARVAGALDAARKSGDQSGLVDEAKRRAAALRRAATGLPLPGGDQGSARARAALGREQALSMAKALERLSLGDAVQSGQDALSSLDDAQRKARAPRGPSDWLDPREVNDAESELRTQLKWAQQQLRQLDQKAENRARPALQKSSQREQALAQRAGNLKARGKNGATALPDGVLENLEQAESIMREAAGRLSGGQGARGLALQRQAQRLLEQADTGKTTDHRGSAPKSPPSATTGGRGIETGGIVPGPDSGKRAEDFRRRVLEGLGKESGGPLAPAVRRYAEGLLQ